MNSEAIKGEDVIDLLDDGTYRKRRGNVDDKLRGRRDGDVEALEVSIAVGEVGSMAMTQKSPPRVYTPS